MSTRLRRSDTAGPGWSLRRRGTGFELFDARGRKLTGDAAYDRVRALVLPPAWQDVWICPSPNGHIQATGVDAAGRRQYRYHDRWTASRSRAKFTRMEDFAARLELLREAVARDLDASSLERATVLAGLVQLLDAGFFRVGSERYAARNRTFGLTTLLRSHATVRRDGLIVFDYTAKHGKRRVERASDPRVGELVGRLKRRRADPHPRLFSSHDDGVWHAVRAADLNAYLKDVSGAAVTAKDFRTWNGTVLAAALLARTEIPARRAARDRAATGVLREVAGALGNTLAVARASYVDPRVVDAWGRGDTIMSREYTGVPSQLARLASTSGKLNNHRLNGTWSAATVGRYDPASDHVQGMAELADRRIAVAQNGGGTKPGFVSVSTNGSDPNLQPSVAIISTALAHPSGMQAAGGLIAVAESQSGKPNRVEIIDARNASRPVTLPLATSGIDASSIPGTLSAAGLAYDRRRARYWLLLAGSSRSSVCRSVGSSLTSGFVGWNCDDLKTNGALLKQAEGGTQLVFDTSGQLYVMAYESIYPKTTPPVDYSQSGVQMVHLSLTNLDGCGASLCVDQKLIGSYRLRKAPSYADPGPNFRWGATVRAGTGMSITSSPRELNGGPARPFMVFLDRYWQ